MASLADELDLDPAFAGDDQHYGSASLADEEGYHGEMSSSPAFSPIQQRRSYGGRAVDSDDEHNAQRAHRRQSAQQSRHTMQASDSFGNEVGLGNLADELGGGSGTEATMQGGFADDLASVEAAPASEEELTRRHREHHLYISETLDDSIRQTKAFLELLRHGAGVGNVAHARDTSTGNGSRLSNTSLEDDTAPVEEKLVALSKLVQAQSSTREDQVRELQECNRVLRRAFEEGGDLMNALVEIADAAEVEALSPLASDEYEQDAVHSSLDDSLSERHPDTSADIDASRFDSLRRPDTTMTPSASFARSDNQIQRALQSKSIPHGDILHLQRSTIDLVHSLAGIHEFTQIAHASISDAARRLRNTRTVLDTYQTEAAELDASLAWISAYESDGVKITSLPNGLVTPMGGDNTVHGHALVAARNRGSAAAACRPPDIQAWTQSQVDKFGHILEEAHERARKLLSPVNDPVLDAIAAGQA